MTTDPRGWQRGLYAITDGVLLPDDHTLLTACDAALRGGLALLQYRDKSGDDARRWRQATSLASLCQDHAVPLIINDDTALALRLRDAGFAGVGLHLGQRDGELAEARQRLGVEALIGATCHARLDLAERAKAEGASYVAFGRFFASRTKPEAPPAPLSLLTEAAGLGLPRVAIGGIDAHTATAARQAGAELLASVEAVFGGSDVEARVRHLNQQLALIEGEHDVTP
ncbi:thiamine-phosphate diphosphorylase [Franzmannia pantelleriensis]|uniref:Thiamine-phosphate synthase n=1 Tax=Franzmannia pantelleriensis TaxID=48727 RepID=A0A1G9L6Z1_9GAMM|nr:thiamine phosphate synthase [Halomonas pantelleriensis]SDL57517.1 thiamine-phosphate diphosphorylase [Halomonas pantelleriensis]